jgi:hypothetical protein
MSGYVGYSLGFEDGQSSAELSRRDRQILDQVFHGRRPVTVDQSYIEQLRRGSDHNFEVGAQAQREVLDWEAKARQFRGEALHWKERALRYEAAATGSDPQCKDERADHEAAVSEIYGLSVFRQLTLWLLEAHDAGRADRPAFAELRALIGNLSERIGRFERITFDDESEEMARIEALVDALQRP